MTETEVITEEKDEATEKAKAELETNAAAQEVVEKVESVIEDDEDDFRSSLAKTLSESSAEPSVDVTKLQSENEALKSEVLRLQNELQGLKQSVEHPTIGAALSLITDNPEITTDLVLKNLVKSDPRNMSNIELYAEKTRAFYSKKLSGEELNEKVLERVRGYEEKAEDEQEEEIQSYKKDRIDSYVKQSDDFIGKRKQAILDAQKQAEENQKMYISLQDSIVKVAKIGKIGNIELEPEWGEKTLNLLTNGIFRFDAKGNLDVPHAIDVLDYAAYGKERKKAYKAMGGKEKTIEVIEQNAAKLEVKAEQVIVSKLSTASQILEAAEREANKNR